MKNLIPADKKFAPINPFVLNTHSQVIDRGTVCSSGSSTTVTGTVDDSGNIKASGTSSGITSCTPRAIAHRTMFLGVPDPADSNSEYVITAECTEKWIWNHCAMPDKGQFYPAILELEKDGSFKVYAATKQKVGGKAAVATFVVLRVEHANQEQEHR